MMLNISISKLDQTEQEKEFIKAASELMNSQKPFNFLGRNYVFFTVKDVTEYGGSRMEFTLKPLGVEKPNLKNGIQLTDSTLVDAPIQDVEGLVGYELSRRSKERLEMFTANKTRLMVEMHLIWLDNSGFISNKPLSLIHNNSSGLWEIRPFYPTVNPMPSAVILENEAFDVSNELFENFMLDREDLWAIMWLSQGHVLPTPPYKIFVEESSSHKAPNVKLTLIPVS